MTPVGPDYGLGIRIAHRKNFTQFGITISPPRGRGTLGHILVRRDDGGLERVRILEPGESLLMDDLEKRLKEERGE